jgi:hypothetical protein
MVDREKHPGPGRGAEGPGEGPLDRPERDAGAPIGDNAYPGGSGLTPPTGDMDDPIPETGMPGEPELEPDQYGREEGIGRQDGDRP